MRHTSLLTAGIIFLTSVAGTPALADSFGGSYCREYSRTIYVGGRAQEGYGKACLQPDGAWEFRNEAAGIAIPEDRIMLPRQPAGVTYTTYYGTMDNYIRPYGWYPVIRDINRTIRLTRYYDNRWDKPRYRHHHRYERPWGYHGGGRQHGYGHDGDHNGYYGHRR